MRFRITLTFNQSQPVLFPVDYRFALAAAVYRVMEQGDSTYSKWLHDTGFADGNKRFKFFTLSPFRFQESVYEARHKALRILSHEAQFTFSTLQIPMGEKFVQGLFANQRITLSQHGHTVHMVVKSVERLPDPVFTDQMVYRAVVPVVVSVRDREVHRHEQFLPPLDVRYEELLHRNLRQKLAVAMQTEGQPLTLASDAPFQFVVIGEAQKRAFSVIRPDGQRPIIVIGYTYTFELEAPLALHEIGYWTGFGEQNSFAGYVEVG